MDFFCCLDPLFLLETPMLHQYMYNCDVTVQNPQTDGLCYSHRRVQNSKGIYKYERFDADLSGSSSKCTGFLKNINSL